MRWLNMLPYKPLLRRGQRIGEGGRTNFNEMAKHVTLQTSTSAGAEDRLNGQKRRSLKTSLPNCQFCELLFSQMDDFIA